MDIEAGQITVDFTNNNLSLYLRDGEDVELRKKIVDEVCKRCKARGENLGSFINNEIGSWFRVCHPVKEKKRDCLPEEEKLNIHEQ